MCQATNVFITTVSYVATVVEVPSFAWHFFNRFIKKKRRGILTENSRPKFSHWWGSESAAVGSTGKIDFLNFVSFINISEIWNRPMGWPFFSPPQTINIHSPFFWPIWLHISEIARNGQSGIPPFFFWKKNLLLSYLSFKIFQRFCKIYTTFLYSTDFHIVFTVVELLSYWT